MEIYRIMAQNSEIGEAYAELLSEVRIMSDGVVYAEDLHGFGSFTDIDHIIINPEVIRHVSGGWCYRIKLPEVD